MEGEEKPVRIRTEVTLEDLIVFNEARNAHSPYVQKKRNGFRRLVTVYLLLAPAFLVSISTYSALWLPVLIVSAILSALFYKTFPGIVRGLQRRALRRMREEGELEFSIGEAELEVLETGLVSRVAGLETKVTWVGLDRVETTSDYTYLYLDSARACIIPHRRILSGDLSAFLKELGLRFPSGASLSVSPTLPSADPS